MIEKEYLPEYKKEISLTVNGKNVKAQIDCRVTLAEFLREELGLTGTKVGCNRGECGSCTVIMDGEPVYSFDRAIWKVGHGSPFRFGSCFNSAEGKSGH